MDTLTAIVTGASSDIGKALTRSLLSSGYYVYAQVNSNKKALQDLQSHPQLSVVQHDLSDISGIERFIRLITQSSKSINCLVNTIGPLLLKSLDKLTPTDWQEQIHFNLNLAFYLTYYLKESLVSSQGHVVNFTFSGVEFLKSRINSTSYCSAKAGLVILTKSLATLLAPYGVRVNAIGPGIVEASVSDDEHRKNMSSTIPVGRPAFPEEIAKVLIWLLLKSPSYVTGSLIPVAGAWEYID